MIYAIILVSRGFKVVRENQDQSLFYAFMKTNKQLMYTLCIINQGKSLELTF